MAFVKCPACSQRVEIINQSNIFVSQECSYCGHNIDAVALDPKEMR